jgi:hypothetical protein
LAEIFKTKTLNFILCEHNCWKTVEWTIFKIHTSLTDSRKTVLSNNPPNQKNQIQTKSLSISVEYNQQVSYCEPISKIPNNETIYRRIRKHSIKNLFKNNKILLPAGISARFSENFLIVLHLKIDGIDA